MVQAVDYAPSMTGEIATALADRERNLSGVIPIYDEEENIPKRLRSARQRLRVRYEIIAVDDGSRNNGAAVLKRHAAEIPELKIVQLRRNSSQEQR
jgi:dolichol-phosphate mannosyltransferase